MNKFKRVFARTQARTTILVLATPTTFFAFSAIFDFASLPSIEGGRTPLPPVFLYYEKLSVVSVASVRNFNSSQTAGVFFTRTVRSTFGTLR